DWRSGSAGIWVLPPAGGGGGGGGAGGAGGGGGGGGPPPQRGAGISVWVGGSQPPSPGGAGGGRGIKGAGGGRAGGESVCGGERARMDELVEDVERFGHRIAGLHRQHRLHDVDDSVAGVIDRGDDVAVTGEMSTEKRRLPAMSPETVRERHQRHLHSLRCRIA